LKQVGIRVESSLGPDKIGAKIREATLQKVPYMLIIGEQEALAKKVAVRSRTAGDQGQIPLTEFIQRCQQEVATRGAAHAVAG
jgi:threonyl-tRNA synthetase